MSYYRVFHTLLAYINIITYVYTFHLHVPYIVVLHTVKKLANKLKKLLTPSKFEEDAWPIFDSFPSAEGTSADFRVMAPSSLVVSSLAPTAVVELFILTDDVALEGVEDFKLTLNLTFRYPFMSFTGARNEFFVNTIQVFIEDRTSLCSDKLTM